MYGFVYFMGFQTLGKSYLYLSFMTDDYNYYHAFTCSWVDGVGDYLLELLGPELMSQPLDVMTGCEDNVGMHDLHTTFMWFLHYTELKRLVQGHQHEGIKMLLPSLFHLLRASNHTKVAGDLC